MVYIERNVKRIIVLTIVFLVGVLVFSKLIMITLKNSTSAFEKTLVITVGIMVLLYFGVFFAFIGRAYEIDASGITLISVINTKRHYSWSNYPFCYLIWFGQGNSPTELYFVFSGKEIDSKKAKKMNIWGRVYSKPRELICFEHTPEREAAIRQVMPDITFEYRNHYLAKRISR